MTFNRPGKLEISGIKNRKMAGFLLEKNCESNWIRLNQQKD